MDQTRIQADLGHLQVPGAIVIQSRLGDQYLSAGTDPRPQLERTYQLLDLGDSQPIVLIGDIDGAVLREVFSRVHPNHQDQLAALDGAIGHTATNLSSSSADVWIKVMRDLSLILQAQTLIVTHSNSNFARIVLFLMPTPTKRPIISKISK